MHETTRPIYLFSHQTSFRFHVDFFDSQCSCDFVFFFALPVCDSTIGGGFTEPYMFASDSWSDCKKAYGTLNHLNGHIAMQRHGPRRSPDGTHLL